MGEWEAWLKAGTGDDKTDIVVIADFWSGTGGLFSRDRDISSNGFQIPWGGFDTRSVDFPRQHWSFDFRLIPKLFFGPGGLPQFGVNTAPSAFSSERGNFSILCAAGFHPYPGVNPNAYPSAPVSTIQAAPTHSKSALIIRAAATAFSITSRLSRQRFRRRIAKPSTGSFMRDLCDKYLTVFADFKYVRSFFDASVAAVPLVLDPFKIPGTNIGFSAFNIRCANLRIRLIRFTVADATIPNFFLTAPVSR